MVTIKRIINPIGIDYLTPYLDPGQDFEDAESMAEGLKNLLASNYNNTFFSMAIEDDTIVGFILAYVPKLDRGVILQSWVQENRGTLHDTLFMRALLWAEQNEIKELQLDTRRTDVESGKRWGFEVSYIVMTLDVPHGVEARLVASLPKELTSKEIKNVSGIPNQTVGSADEHKSNVSGGDGTDAGK